MSCERTEKQVLEDIQCAEQEKRQVFQLAKEKIKFWNMLIQNLQEKLKKIQVKEEKKFYIGSKFLIASGSEYVLALVAGREPRLIKTKDGMDKAGSYRFDIPVEEDENGLFIKRLPSAYPGDFGLAEYGAKFVNDPMPF